VTLLISHYAVSWNQMLSLLLWKVIIYEIKSCLDFAEGEDNDITEVEILARSGILSTVGMANFKVGRYQREFSVP
jgi:hypothetical protein